MSESVLIEGPPGRLRGFMLVKHNEGPWHRGRCSYRAGQVYVVSGWTRAPLEGAAPGILVQSFDACLRVWRPGWNILTTEIRAEDAAPATRAGFVRCRRIRVMGEMNLSVVRAMKDALSSAVSS